MCQISRISTNFSDLNTSARVLTLSQESNEIVWFWQLCPIVSPVDKCAQTLQSVVNLREAAGAGSLVKFGKWIKQEKRGHLGHNVWHTCHCLQIRQILLHLARTSQICKPLPNRSVLYTYYICTCFPRLLTTRPLVTSTVTKENSKRQHSRCCTSCNHLEKHTAVSVHTRTKSQGSNTEDNPQTVIRVIKATIQDSQPWGRCPTKSERTSSQTVALPMCRATNAVHYIHMHTHIHAYRYIHDTSVGCCLPQLSHFHEFVKKLCADWSTFCQIGQTFDKLDEIGQICKLFASLSKLNISVRCWPISRNSASLSRKGALQLCPTLTSSSTFDKFDKLWTIWQTSYHVDEQNHKFANMFTNFQKMTIGFEKLPFLFSKAWPLFRLSTSLSKSYKFVKICRETETKRC